MTRIQELEREVELLKEIIKLRRELNNIPQYQPAVYPRWQEYQYGVITCNDVGNVSISTTPVSGVAATSGFVQLTDWNKMVDGPASWPKPGEYTVGYGG